MVSRTQYLGELSQIRENLKQMGEKTVTALEEALSALVGLNAEAAANTRRLEKEIDAMYKQIDDQCVACIATQQPMASDLRFLVATMKIASEVERIGDYANNIAKMVQRKFTKCDMAPLESLHEKVSLMMREGMGMLGDAIRAYSANDGALALTVLERDVMVNKINRDLYRGILAAATVNPWLQETALDFHTAVRYIERVADRATNVAEWVSYIVTGYRVNERD